VRVVALGGGHGLAVTLSALRLVGVEPTAVVTVADDGGSSGRLRRDLGMLAPGDLRKAMLALADPDAEVRELFAYRFERGDLAGHNLGNLALAALTDLKGGFSEALAEASRWLRVHGQVLPATLVPVRLCGRVDGRQVEGQVAIMTATGRVEAVWLEPRRPAAVPAAVLAVRRADLVLLGPGSTFTSVVPNLLVPELAAALVEDSRHRLRPRGSPGRHPRPLPGPAGGHRALPAPGGRGRGGPGGAGVRRAGGGRGPRRGGRRRPPRPPRRRPPGHRPQGAGLTR
jgi:uncharacterized cofD-like protein